MTEMKKKALLQNTLDALELTQLELGLEIGIGQSHVSEMLSGERPIRKYHLQSLEAILRRRNKWPLRSTAQKPG